MGALEFAISVFGVFLVLWSRESSLIQGSRNVDMGNVNTLSQENLEKRKYVEGIIGIQKRFRKIGYSTDGVSLLGRLKKSGGIEQIGKKLHLGGKKSSESSQKMKRTIKATSENGTMSQGGKDSKTDVKRNSLEGKDDMFTFQVHSGNGKLKRRREKRHLQQEKQENIRENFTQTGKRENPSTSAQNATCLKNCTAIRHVFQNGKTHCHCDVCCSKASDICCMKQNTLGLGRYSIPMSPTHCNCSQEFSKPKHPKMDSVSSECINDYWMITSCRSSWPQDEISHKCRTGSSGFRNKATLKDLHLFVPVFTPNRKVFRNRYCALCNNETTFEPYKVVIKCETSPPASYSPKKAIEYLFSRCNQPEWQPQGNHPSQPCPQIHLSCSGGGVRFRKENLSSITSSEFKVTISSSDSLSYCLRCKTLDTNDCLASSKPRLKIKNTDDQFLTTVSLSFTLDLMDDAEKPTLVKISCPREKPVYDPYLEECRYGLIPPPKSAPFDSYRIRLFIENFTLTVAPALGNFRVFLEKEFGFGVYQQRYFTQGYQFDTRIGRMTNNSAESHKLKKYLNFTSQFNISINNVSLSVYKVTYRILTCTNLEYYKKHEYAILDGYMPGVYLNTSREILSYFNYYSVSNNTISVCRLQLSNCIGAFISLEEDEYTALRNSSITVKESGKIYDQKDYDIHNGTLWICVDFSRTFSVYKTSKKVRPLALSVITFVCKSLSIIGLVFVLVTYSLFSELRTPPGINLMNLSVSILLAQLLWLLGSGQTDTPMACTVIAVILHYFFLVSFVWTSIIAFDTWRAFSAKGRRPLADSKAQRMKHCLRLMAVGWLPVMVYVAICVGLDNFDIIRIGYGSSDSCFITATQAKLYFFTSPVIFFIIFNFVFFVLTVKAIKQTRSQTTKLIGHQLDKKHEFRIYVRIASLMGFTWIFGFAAPFGWQFLWYPFVILNGLQGVYIALAFGFGKYARKLYRDLYHGNRRGNRNRQSTSRSGRRERSTKESLL